MRRGGEAVVPSLTCRGAHMNLQIGFNFSEDKFPLPTQIKKLYGPFGFPANADGRRPYITSNFVMGLDGRASFRELDGRAGGREVSKSKEDRWLMDFIRAHHDAQLMGASTLREERGRKGRGLDFGIDDEELRSYRQDVLKLGRQKIIVLTGSGDLDLRDRLFNSARVEAWVLTSARGEKRLRRQIEEEPPQSGIKIISVGKSGKIDVATAVRMLRHEYGIRTLLCEGGPKVYGELLSKKLIDEDFRTISLQVLGASTKPKIERPTPYGSVSFTPETAPWFKLISLHYALPYHAFLRLRFEGPRKFQHGGGKLLRYQDLA
jgi:riboflavin biosynthesis pyrimidine reductase